MLFGDKKAQIRARTVTCIKKSAIRIWKTYLVADF